jgi:hypothetical protein
VTSSTNLAGVYGLHAVLNDSSRFRSAIRIRLWHSRASPGLERTWLMQSACGPFRRLRSRRWFAADKKQATSGGGQRTTSPSVPLMPHPPQTAAAGPPVAYCALLLTPESDGSESCIVDRSPAWWRLIGLSQRHGCMLAYCSCQPSIFNFCSMTQKHRWLHWATGDRSRRAGARQPNIKAHHSCIPPSYRAQLSVGMPVQKRLDEEHLDQDYCALASLHHLVE